MNWLNLRLTVLRSAEYIGCEPTARATWLNVLAYSAEQENGGRIAGARRWKDRQWQQTCGVTLAEVEGSNPLLLWDGDDLIVWGYPAEKEAEVQAKREGGMKGGRRSGEARREPLGEAELQAVAKLKSSSLRREGEGKEKGKEGEREDAALPTLAQAIAFGGTAGIPAENCERYHRSLSENNGWIRGGLMVNWRSKFKRWNEEDKTNSRPSRNGHADTSKPKRHEDNI